MDARLFKPARIYSRLPKSKGLGCLNVRGTVFFSDASTRKPRPCALNLWSPDAYPRDMGTSRLAKAYAIFVAETFPHLTWVDAMERP